MAKLIILCGLPGSGKSTYAEELIKHEYLIDFETERVIRPECVIHSFDAIRKELFGDAGFQGDNNRVFETMHKRTREDLRAGKTVIYDATNITRKARRGAINLADPDDIVECHIIWADPHECARRDSLRDRKVGPEVIDKMLRRWQSPWRDEGFDDIHIILNQQNFDQVSYIASMTANMHIPHDNPHHKVGVWEHCQQANSILAQIIKEDPSKEPYYHRALIAATMWHDIGKPLTKGYKTDKETGKIDYSVAHYYDHHCVGGYLAYGLFLNNQLMCIEYNEEICFISWLISTHMEPFFDSHYYRDLKPRWKYYIDLLHAADLAAH